MGREAAWQQASVTRQMREAQAGHRSAILWFTGLSGAGKSTLAHAVEKRLHQMNYRTFVMDGDNVRSGLCGDLGFSLEDRSENIRRISEVAKLMMEAGIIVLTAFISPLQKDRSAARRLVSKGDFFEIFCDTPLDVCESRDVKGFYQSARSGVLNNFTGISSPYETPECPDLTIRSDERALDESVGDVLAMLQRNGVIGAI